MNENLTRNGIAYDLTISPYRLVIQYEFEDLEYVFSSELYRTKFKEKLEENRSKINESLSKRFGYTIKNDLLCDLKLYDSTEKRGFLIKTSEKDIECLSIIELNGNKLIYKN